MSVVTTYFDGVGYTAANDRAAWYNTQSDGVTGPSDFRVTEHSPANLSVDVQTGYGFCGGYGIENGAVVNVAISSNTSGYNRIDLIVANIDTTAKSTTFIAVAGVPSSSPVAPTPTATQLQLAQVLVGNGASAINQNVITDVRGFNTKLTGWVPDNSTWTYTSATTFTIPGNVTGVFTKGLKLKWYQSGWKYGYVYSSSYASATNLTTVTINGHSTYTIANATIYYPHISRATAPAGFPEENYNARAYLSGSDQLDLVDSTATKVLLNGETYDPAGCFSSYKYTVPISGYYMVNGQVTFKNVIATKLYVATIYVNGTPVADAYAHSALAQSISANPRDLLYLTAGQYVELYATSYAGVSTVDIINGTRYTFLEVAFMGI